MPLGLRFATSSGKITGTVSKTAKAAFYTLRICATGSKRSVGSGESGNTACASTRLVVVKAAVSRTPSTTFTTSPSLIPPASALTKPPTDLRGINDHAEVFSTGLDPAFVTLGPKLGNRPSLPSYSGQTGLVEEVANGSPVLAPLNLRFIGFNDRNSDYRIAANGIRQVPFDDLELCFESTSTDWPGLIFCVYHLQNSPLLRGLNQSPLCSNATEWPGPLRAEGHQFFTDADYMLAGTTTSASCQALLGRSISRGSVIGYAGSVGSHSQAPIRIKVRDRSINSTVKKGDQHLHWVQPDVFFYWKCFAPGVEFAPGVLAYPFDCDGYRVPSVQRSVEFKYAN
ncbi:hypothetical protein GALL_356610 [mine drainage metagenome]|uniref:Uncharacterized protein n=1 Tax=mine drainage metagenome TaxID=410659 RepID=A0A1J5QH37_9ZZZZ